MGMFAIIETLGRQYKVSVGDKIKVDRVNSDAGREAAEGEKITFTEVLYVGAPEGEGVESNSHDRAVGADPVWPARRVQRREERDSRDDRRGGGHGQAGAG